jgi:L-asparaginase
MASGDRRVVILGTGGTIAGTAADAADNTGYAAAQIGVSGLVAAIPPLAARAIEVEQVAQIDSKDMTLAVLHRLAQRIQHHIDRDDVAGVVVTHGTDTLEETAYALHRVLLTGKPVVLTAAMRPATSLQADGPQNLLDAVTVAGVAAQGGVVAVLAGQIWAGAEVRKLHTYRIDAMAAGDAGAVGWIEDGQLRPARAWPASGGLGASAIPLDDRDAPWVAIVTSHAGADGREVDALVTAGVRGLVVATTGNGTIHVALERALQRARATGVAVLRATRCALGGIVGKAPAAFDAAGSLTPAQARIELVLRLYAGGPGGRGAGGRVSSG